ncbi:zf-HC2 domain-containing protein [Enemella dayhoffiae]|uniref:zf-HC2 domain-containing protein n=1 Tax=Enemella dayhoffiae TaxID=2016507 RepID=UPI0011408383|nr:zf-HC2 domain-containing protein [Enemella dayhoffiae]
MTHCPDRPDQLSAFVDGALGLPARDRVRAHLVDCADCRAEVAELRGLRERVRRGAGEPGAPHHLTNRLSAIAGEGRTAPLYARPFDSRRTPGASAGRLPSRRRRLRRIAAGSVAGSSLALAGAVGVGWAAAPPTRTPALDPAPTARGEFAAVLAADGLGNPAVATARGTDRGGPRVERVSLPTGPVGPMQPAGAREQLERADLASRSFSLSGTQVIQVRHLNGYWTATAEVQSDPRGGSQVVAAGSDRQKARTWWPAVAGTEPDSADRVAERHSLVSGPGPVVAGRQSQLVEARTPTGAPVSRWWLDRDSGVVLWQQTFDEAGQTVVSAGWQRLTIGAGGAASTRPRTMAVNAALSSVGSSAWHASALVQQGWSCSDSLAGLELTEVRRGAVGTAGAGQGETLHAVYSDGVTTLGVLQQRGALGGAPQGFVWDPELDAYRSLGMTTMLTWQSGNTVYTVITDGSVAQAARAVASLPHEPPVLRTRTERVLDGWNRILGGGR